MACTLTAEGLAERELAWRRLAERALIGSERLEGGAVQRYERAPGVADELRELLGLEAECCGFLEFELREEEGEIILRVSGPPEAAEIVEAFA
jgi:hypothetical protein